MGASAKKLVERPELRVLAGDDVVNNWIMKMLSGEKI